MTLTVFSSTFILGARALPPSLSLSLSWWHALGGVKPGLGLVVAGCRRILFLFVFFFFLFFLFVGRPFLPLPPPPPSPSSSSSFPTRVVLWSCFVCACVCLFLFFLKKKLQTATTTTTTTTTKTPSIFFCFFIKSFAQWYWCHLLPKTNACNTSVSLRVPYFCVYQWCTWYSTLTYIHGDVFSEIS